ncbi:MAG: hypothetical protein PHT03_02505 [Bacilli bacterium]|nr:hypothetical protein [Bacilli bacterium]
MKKLTRKTYISIFTAFFIFLSLGAITFAWFTLTTTVKVEEFQAKITSGTGIEVSLDAIAFARNIRNEDIVEQIKTNLKTGNAPIELDAVSTSNGYSNFKKINIEDYPDIPILKTLTEADEENPGKWIWFNLYFRTPEPDIWVYLLSDTDIISEGKLWPADVKYKDAEGFEDITEGTLKRVYASNSLRLSFLTCNINVDKIGLPNPIGEESKSVVIYELDPSYSVKPNLRDKNQRLDTALKPYGLVDYFRIKTGDSMGIDLLTFFNNEVLPPDVLGNNHLVDADKLDSSMDNKAAIVKLDAYHEGSGFYYGAVKIQMWIEGWDPDCYNAVLADDLKIKLSFGGSSQTPGILPIEIDPETEYSIEYIWDENLGTLLHENPAVVKKHELPLFLKPASIEGYVFDGWYFDEIYSDLCKCISRDPVFEVVEERNVIKLYGKIS